MKSVKLKATSLRLAMLTAILLLVGLSVGGFYYAQIWLRDLAAGSNSTPIATNLNQSDLNSLQTELNGQKIAIDKATNITVPVANYLNQIQTDLNTYAANTGLTIVSATEDQTPVGTATMSIINGVQPKYILVTLKSPVSYVNLIKFIKAIETNLPKIKIVDLKLSRVSGTDDSVNIEPITIEVYAR